MCGDVGLNPDEGEKVLSPQFVDDIMLFSEGLSELEVMTNEFMEESVAGKGKKGQKRATDEFKKNGITYKSSEYKLLNQRGGN